MPALSSSRLAIPTALRDQLLEFRRRLWTIKLVEAVAGALAGVVLGYLLTYGLDRLFDTPQWLRGLLFVLSIVGCGLIPWAAERWVWRRRRLDQLAQLLSERYPSVGDQLLGIIELVNNESEQARSRRLVEAAIAQVAAEAAQQDFSTAVPRPRHRQRVLTAGLLVGLACVLLGLTTAAATNAWWRFATPWSNTPRYTFAAVSPLPERIVVPHGEPVEWTLQLVDGSEWHPQRGEVRLGSQPPLTAELLEQQYRFELPAQLQSARMRVRVGDFIGESVVEPMYRPELKELRATVQLPDYLERSEPLQKEVRGAAFRAVAGSQVTLTATASRELSSALVDRSPQPVHGASFSTPSRALQEVATEEIVELSWEDQFGLTAQKPFVLSLQGVEDEAPNLVCENLPRQRILLDSEVLTFQVRGRDDFGVKRLGIEWRGLDPAQPHLAQGERLIGAGNSAAEQLDAVATFQATQLGIEPQPIELKVFIEDYLPGRPRVYGPTCVFFVLSAEEHAIWVTAQLSRWQRMALDVRDRERQMYETNRELRELSPAELDAPETRQQIELQAAAEKANGRRLSGLVTGGEELLTQAMRNPEIGVGHLEKWAEMLQVLKDISGNRMPSVADLLQQSAEAPRTAADSVAGRPAGPQAGQNRLQSSGGTPAETKPPEQTPRPPVPTISDVESSFNPLRPGSEQDAPPKQPSDPRLTLPNTMLAGAPKAGDQPPPPAGEKLDEAVTEQRDLLAEFEKVAEELNAVLANLEGTTLIKRLKAASRRQQLVSNRLAGLVQEAFGAQSSAQLKSKDVFEEVSQTEERSAQDVSRIMDDMSAYFDRSQLARFKVVLDDMRSQDVTGALRDLSEQLRAENGLAIAQVEYWSDTLDRWAEDLAEACQGGQCPGGKSKGSLPPSIVLEVLQILEGEMNLREQTREVEQARPALEKEGFRKQADELADVQDGLRERIDRVIERILELPDAQNEFGKELKILDAASLVMDEARGILSRPETGPPAIAAETEVIELLLQSRRFNPNGGGGGGANPGGGGSGDTNDSALALVGSGQNEREVREERQSEQSTGSAGVVLPEEFRAGLDEYFNRLDAGR